MIKLRLVGKVKVLIKLWRVCSGEKGSIIKLWKVTEKV